MRTAHSSSVSPPPPANTEELSSARRTPHATPYLAFALLIYAGLDGVRAASSLPAPADVNLFTAPEQVTASYRKLPETLDEAKQAARASDFARRYLPESLIAYYTR